MMGEMSTYELTDSHCHLESLENPVEACERARSAGISRIIAIANDEPTYRRSRELKSDAVELYTTLGTHPHEALTYDEEHWIKLFEHEQSNICAVGECGLDYFYDHAPKDCQQKVFEHQLEVALKIQKPVVVHVRDSFDDTLAIIRPYAEKGVQGVVHCFTGSVNEIKLILDLGWYVGFTGIITFGASAEPIREAVQVCPLDRLLIETDSPYLAPKPYRGKPNEPAFVVEVAKKVSVLKRVALEEICAATHQNTEKLFNLD